MRPGGQGSLHSAPGQLHSAFRPPAARKSTNEPDTRSFAILQTPVATGAAGQCENRAARFFSMELWGTAMTQLPTGTVAFLFTDIEGSTGRWERDPVAMAAAVNRHLALLQKVIKAHGGVHFKTVGDALQAAFPTAAQALAAAVDGQRALIAEDWSEVDGLPVRMALHAGDASPDERGDYLAAPLNRLSRLLSTAHGGQVLLSQAVQQLTRDVTPSGCALDDLGEHRLRDLIEPERIFQLRHPELPGQFPPIRSLDTRNTNLPRQPNAFFGREREVREIVGLVRRGEVQILTLTGPGGTGKTRLAMQAAAELLDDFPDGVFLVELAPLTDPGLVPAAIAGALGLREEGGKTPRESVFAYLHTKRLLLILDNFEQLLEAAPFAGELLAACPGLEIIATSRAPLRLRAERHYPVPPLALPDTSGGADLDALANSEAVRFFVERAQTASPAFAPSADTLPIIAEIVRRLDGLPLAIELAAARIRMLTPAALLARLEQRLPLLTGGARDAPDRQRTLRAAIAWSYDLLADDERVVFRRLAVFAAGCTFDAAEPVCSPDGDLDILTGLEVLVDHSLVRQGEMADGQPRFAMLETISEFAQELLAASGEDAELRQRHAEYFLELAETANTFRFSEHEGAWHERLLIEYPNLRAAMQWLLDQRDSERLLLLAGALAGLWIVRAQHREGSRWLNLALAGEGTASARLRCLYRASVLAEQEGDVRQSTILAEEALELARRDGNEQEVADAQRRLGQMLIVLGDLPRGSDLLDQALSWHRGAGDAPGAADVLRTLADVAELRGDLELARTFIEESVDFSRIAADERGIASGAYQLAFLSLAEGDGDRAIAHMEDAVSRWQQAQTTSMVALAQASLAAFLADHQGDDARAETLSAEAAHFWREAGNDAIVAVILDVLGQVANRRGDQAQAEALHREALALALAMPEAVPRVGASVRAYIGLGRAALASGDSARALDHCRAGLLCLGEAPEDQWGSRGPNDDGLYGVAAACLRLVARATALGGQAEEASRVLGSAEAFQAAAHFPLLRAERARADGDARAIRDLLPESAFNRAFAEGEGMTPRAVIDDALRLTRGSHT